MFRWAGASNDHQAALMLLPLAGVTVNFTAAPCGAVGGAAVNEAPPAAGVVGGVVTVVVPNAIQSRFWPSPWKSSSRTWVPAVSLTAITWFSMPVAVGIGVMVGDGASKVEPRVAVVYVSNDPVFGTRYGIDRPPSNETSTQRLLLGLATRSDVSSPPVVETFTV